MDPLPHGAVRLSDDGLELVVAQLAPLMGLSEEGWRTQMAAGRLLVRTEKGVGEDEGRWRITLRLGRTRLEVLLLPDGKGYVRRLSGPAPRGLAPV